MAANSLRIAWLLNLDADRELQDPVRYRPAELRRDAIAPIADLVAPTDVVLEESPVDPPVPPEHWMALAFCPTPRALARIVRLGFAAPAAPPLETLRRVNDRAFCAELGQSLPAACFARDIQTLERHVAAPSPTGAYVIKRAFSFAGRERRRVQTSVLDDSTRGFCRRSFANGEGLQVEPWVERLADFSRHGYLSRAGELTIGPTREQRCDAMGRFLGISTDPANATAVEVEALESELRATAAALHAAGYFGPFGIDGFRYRLPSGEVAFNPRCEINARFTMGYPRALLLEALSREA